MIFLRVKHLSNRYWKDLQYKILLDHNDNKCACIHHVTFFLTIFTLLKLVSHLLLSVRAHTGDTEVGRSQVEG